MYANGVLSYTPSDLHQLEEIARTAALSLSDDGALLFDQFVNHQMDADAIGRMMSDAISAIVSRCSDICRRGENTTLFFRIPDFIADNAVIVEMDLDRFISLNILASWLNEHSHPKATDAATRATAALEKAVRIMKTRRIPE